VEVVCTAADGHVSGLQRGVITHRLTGYGQGRVHELSVTISLFIFLVMNLRRFSLLHVHGLRRGAFVACLAALLCRRPVYAKPASGGLAGDVRYVRNSFWRRWLVLRYPRAFQALSEEISGELLAAGIERQRIVRLPNGIDADKWANDGETKNELRQKLGLPRDDLILLYAGRFSREKGLNVLYSVWPKVARAGSTLLLLGRHAASPALPELPDMLMRDWTENVRDYYRAADVFVLPSLMEGMSNALLEAMASGLPVIATRVGAAEEVIKDGVTGLLVEPGNSSELAEALDRLVTHSALAKSLGEAAAKDVQQRFAIQSVVDRLEATYDSIVGT
jgi:glycosyltransferase involved in cell wall biosynthesis